MGRVSEQVESLRIEITSNQNARTSLASTHLDHRPKIANTDSHSTHTHTARSKYTPITLPKISCIRASRSIQTSVSPTAAPYGS